MHQPRRLPFRLKQSFCQVQLANMAPKLYAPVGQMSTEANEEENGSLILKELDLGGLQQ